MTGAYVDQNDLNRVLKSPTGATALTRASLLRMPHR